MVRLVVLAVAAVVAAATVVAAGAAPATAGATPFAGRDDHDGTAARVGSDGRDGTAARDALLPLTDRRYRGVTRRCHPCRGGHVSFNACEAGTKCLKNAFAKGGSTHTCAVDGHAGHPCKTACTVCGNGLVCASHGRCVRPQTGCGVPRCGRCGGSRTCAKGTTCVRGFCRRTGVVGMKCSRECGGCMPGLGCVSGVCTKLVVVGRCGPCGGSRTCTNGTTCVRGFCRRTGVVGMKCSRECGGCMPGLGCVSGVCTKLVVVGRCSPCGGSRTCTNGTTCERGFCRRTGDLGMKCSDECGGCKAGVACVSGVCTKLVVVGRCSPCGGSRKCGEGTTCERGFCRRTGDLGMKCSDECGGCKAGVACVSGVCKRLDVVVGRCSPCGGSRKCGEGTTCVGGTCTSAGRIGDKCSKACGACTGWLECGAEGICEASLDDFSY